MVFEGDPFLCDVAAICQRVDLETTRIRQDRLVPIHELVKPPGPCNQLIPWPQPEVVGVGQDDTRAHLF